MAELQFYRPSPVAVPENSPLRRRFPNYDDVDPQFRHRFDARTIFYDVFFDSEANRLIGIGPALMNLRKYFFRMALYVDGNRIKWKLRTIKQLIFFQSEPLPQLPNSKISVEFRFKEFSLTLNLDASIADISNPDDPYHFTVSTLQKDNEGIWIADWITWHCRAHGIERIVLYDNGSGNRDEVVALMSNLDLDVRIILVDWNFPFGNRPSKTCQLGSLNHCRLRFPIHEGYCINNDIDEYLFISQGSLLEFVQGKLRRPAPGAVMYRSITIPNIPQTQSDPSVPRPSDYKYRLLPNKRETSKRRPRHFPTPKYIYSFDDIGYNGVHTTDSIKNAAFAKRYPIRHIAKFLIRKVIRESYKPIARWVGSNYTRPRIDAVYAPPSEICFLHFQGLRTDWRSGNGQQRTGRQEFDPSRLAVEPRIVKIAELIGDRASTASAVGDSDD